MKPRRDLLVRNLWSLLIALAAAGGVCALYLLEEAIELELLGAVEARLVDQRFRLRGPRPVSGEVVVVAIDSRSIAALGRWPWSRTRLAELVERLRGWGASAVAFDVLFTEPEGAREAERLERIAAALPPEPPAAARPVAEAVRQAVDRELEQVQADLAFARVLERTFADDRALTVLGYDLALEREAQARQLGPVLGAADEQVILDVGSYATRDANAGLLRREPPALALGVRPVVAALAAQSAAVGFVNPVFDRDGALRRERLLVAYAPAAREAFLAGREPRGALADPAARVEAVFPLAVAAVATHLRLPLDQLVLDLPRREVRLPGRGPGGEPVERALRFDPEDGTMRIDFHGGAAAFPTYSVVDVLRGAPVEARAGARSGPEAFAGKLVLVGATDPGLGDDFVTPFTSRLPGVEKHANVAENLLAGRQLRAWSEEELVTAVSAAAAAVGVALLAGNLPPLLAALLVLAVGGGFFGWTYHDFAARGLVWNWTVPGLTTLLGYAGVTVYRQVGEHRARRAQEARSRFIQDTFGRYLSDQVVSLLLDSPEGLKLGGEKRRLTILMSDLRGFTSLCERSTPEAVIDMLNTYLGRMADIVLKHGGTVDEFIGDAVLALFGAPVAHEDDARRAVACAIEMQMAMAEVNAYCRSRDLPEVEMGIAINTGDVIVGNIGSERRSKYGVVGSAVNLTARIESNTVGGQVLVSDETLREAGDVVAVGERTEVKAKGVKEPVSAWDLKAIGPPWSLKMPEAAEKLVPLPEPLRVRFSVLEGKHVSATLSDGELVTLSAVGGDLRCARRLAPLVNLKMKVVGEDGAALDGDVYAKVVDRASPEGCCALRFTSVPPGVKAFLKRATPAA